MGRKIIAALLVIIFLKVNFANAANPTSSNSKVSASVASTNFYPPSLVAPPNNFATNSGLIKFIWLRPTPNPLNLHHYDLYIDNVVFAASISDSIVFQDYYFYTASSSGNYFYVTLKQSPSEGYHTWKVAVYDNVGQNATTGNWNFYIDTISPFISLTKVNQTEYNWDTTNPTTIPDEPNRYLFVDTENALIGGKVEANSNLQVSLICPTNAPSECVTQSWITNSTDGNWEKQFMNLIPGVTYTIQLSATDATSNSTIFPPFYLLYTSTPGEPGPSLEPTSLLTITPTYIPEAPAQESQSDYILVEPETLPEGYNPYLENTATDSGELLPVTETLKPPSELSTLITPTPYLAKTPPAPSLPPQKIISQKKGLNGGIYILLFFLCLGLPIHLVITSIAVNANLSNFLSFIFTLGFPFLKRKSVSTTPFTFIELYNPDKLNKKVYRTVSDIKGNIFFPSRLPNKSFITLKKTGYTWKNQILPSNILNDVCLSPSPKRFLGAKEELQGYFYSIKLIPLITAIVSSSIGLYFFPNSYLLVYFYLSLQYTFSEYIYPKLGSKS